MSGSMLELRLAVSVLSRAANAMESCRASGHGKHVYVGFFQALNPTNKAVEYYTSVLSTLHLLQIQVCFRTNQNSTERSKDMDTNNIRFRFRATTVINRY